MHVKGEIERRRGGQIVMSRPLAHPESTRLRIQAFHLRHCIGQTGKPQLAQTGRLTQILSLYRLSDFTVKILFGLTPIFSCHR